MHPQLLISLDLNSKFSFFRNIDDSSTVEDLRETELIVLTRAVSASTTLSHLMRSSGRAESRSSDNANDSVTWNC